MRNCSLGTGRSRYKAQKCLLGKASILARAIEPCFEMSLEKARTCHGDFVHYKIWISSSSYGPPLRILMVGVGEGREMA